jgi:magnesium transporter
MAQVARPTIPEPGVINSRVYAAGKRVADVPLDEAGSWVKRPGHTVWIGLFEPSEDLLRRVQAQFALHPLAVEDAGKAHQRPKLEQYGDSLFVVARTAQMVAGRVAFGETHLFVGKGYVISIRHGASTSYAPVRDRCEASPAMLANGEDYILYALLDFIVDNYVPVLEASQGAVEAIEDRVLVAALSQEDVRRLYQLRRDLLRLRNAAAPLLDVCRSLEHADGVAIDREMQPLFRDVTDHVHNVCDQIDALREVLAFAFEASMLAAQTQQTMITRLLAAWAAILAVPTAVTGVYGMNFANMPELTWKYGYFAVVAVIAVICVTLFLRFRKAGWL